MIVTPYFVYVHLHKSGGTFVNQALLRHVPGARVAGYHLPAALAPPEARHLPLLGLVRNPWSYYVSWFSFQQSLPQPNHLYRSVSAGGRLGFKESVGRLLRLEGDAPLLAQVLAGLPEHYLNQGLNLPRPALEPIRGSGLGFYSYLYRHMYGERPAHIGRMETLREELPGLLRRAGFEPPSALLDTIAHGEALNRSPHADYHDYYDEELRGLVERCDGGLIRRYGYAF